jgi:hypothetical protein
MNQYALDQLNKKSNLIQNQENKDGENFKDFFQANVNIDATYSYNANITMNSAAVDQLMKEGQDIRDSVRNLVQDMLERQGFTIEQLKRGEIEKIDVDEITQEKAKELIGPGGALSPENVSDRIVNFAIAGFGGDKSKIDIIRNAIDRGFAEAKRMLGGELAEVSQKTYELIQQKLDNWINDGEIEELNTENS